MSDAFRDSVKDDDGEFPESWSPNPGDMIVGLVDGYETNVGRYSSTVCRIRSEDDGKLYSVWISTTVLAEKFQALKPKPDERIAIRYLGKHPKKDYKRWIVKIDREAVEGDVPDFMASNMEDIVPPELEPEARETVPPTEPDDDLPF